MCLDATYVEERNLGIRRHAIHITEITHAVPSDRSSYVSPMSICAQWVGSQYERLAIEQLRVISGWIRVTTHHLCSK